ERGEAPVGKCLLENVIIGGGNLTSVVLEGPASDLVAGNCLLVSGDAPAIVFDSAASRDADPLHRGLRLLATTVASSQSAIVVRHEESDRTPVPIDVLVRRSILLRPSGAARSSAAMAMLSGWPHGDGGLGNSRIHRLTFQAEESLFVGWPQLLTLTNSAGEPVDRIAADTDAWRKYWNQGMRSDAVLTESVSLSYPSAVTPDAIHAQLSALAPASGQLPGCRPAEFPEQPTGLIEHVVAATRRPYDPEHLGSGTAITGEPVRFDLGLRRSLARFLASD